MNISVSHCLCPCLLLNAKGLPVVSSDNPVRVEHWDELEHKHVAQHVRTWVISSKNEVEETVKHKRGRSFSWMHTAAEEEHLQTHTGQEGGRMSFPPSQEQDFCKCTGLSKPRENVTLLPGKRCGLGVLVSGNSLGRHASLSSCMPLQLVTVRRSTLLPSRELHSNSL